jgi:hypothetical protein
MMYSVALPREAAQQLLFRRDVARHPLSLRGFKRCTRPSGGVAKGKPAVSIATR